MACRHKFWSQLPTRNVRSVPSVTQKSRSACGWLVARQVQLCLHRAVLGNHHSVKWYSCNPQRPPLCIRLHLQIALDTSYWTVINHVFIWGSVATYFSILFTMHSNGIFGIFPNQFPFVGKWVLLSVGASVMLSFIFLCNLFSVLGGWDDGWPIIFSLGMDWARHLKVFRLEKSSKRLVSALPARLRRVTTIAAYRFPTA